eukprot:1145734-Pelagomonas_calceolata.AAC.3
MAGEEMVRIKRTGATRDEHSLYTRSTASSSASTAWLLALFPSINITWGVPAAGTGAVAQPAAAAAAAAAFPGLRLLCKG